jgi:hypothetical protein
LRVAYISDSSGVRELRVSVDVDLDDTVANGGKVFVLLRTRATVEDEEDGLVIRGLELLLDVGLVLSKKLGVELHVSWLVDSMDILCSRLISRHLVGARRTHSEAGRYGKVWGNWL